MRQPSVTSATLPRLSTSCPAEVTEGWRTRRLAYTIDGKRDGYFVVLRLQAPPESIGELERALQINENILRHMVLRADAPAA